jgi:hypothetical protein
VDRDLVHDPAELPTAAAMDALLIDPEFRTFGGRGCLSVSRGGTLENQHGLVHQWIGPLMRTARAPADPVFWFHHSYVDKFWADWQRRHAGAPECLDAPLAGIPGPWHVRDVLEIADARLGYEYADRTFDVTPLAWLDNRGGFTFEARVPSDLRTVTVHLYDPVVVGHGEPPLWFEVRADEAGPLERIALFGLGEPHSHDDHGGHGAPASFQRARSVRLRLAAGGERFGDARRLRLTLVPHYREAATPRAFVKSPQVWLSA